MSSTASGYLFSLRALCRVTRYVLVGMFALAAAYGQSAEGTIEGRVFNAATGAALSKARISIEGTNRETVTDESGSFRLLDVPAGEVRVTVSYLGLERQSTTLQVTAAQVTHREFELVRVGAVAPPQVDGAPVQLKEFTVVVDREMSAQAIAMNEQRNAPNLKNVVAIDEFGDQGDENVGEFLRFLPGVSIEDSGLVALEVQVRGFPSSNTGMMVDGGEMVGARSGDTRAVSLLEVPMSNVSRVEVTKVPTPDMPASGLGGSINLISRSGFETKRRVFNYQVYSLFHNRSGITFDGGRTTHIPDISPSNTQPSFNFSYLHPVNKSLAITVGGSRTWRQKPMEEGDDGDETGTWNLTSLVQTQSDWQSLAQVLKTRSGQIGVDWRISPNNTLSTSIQYRDTSSIITRSRFIAAYGAGATGDSTHTQGAATGVGTATQGNGNHQDVPTENTHMTLKFAHRGDRWRFDASTSFSEAETRLWDLDRGYFFNSPATITNLIIRGDGIPSSGGTIPTRYAATSRTGAPVDLYDGGNYSLVSGNSMQRRFHTMKTAGRMDLARDFTGRLPFTLKTGVSMDRMEKDNRTWAKTWNFRPNGLTDVTSRLARNFDVFDEEYNATAPTIYGTPMRWISVPKVWQLYQQHPDWFVLDEPLAHQNQVTTSRKLIETISAAYLRSDVRLLSNRLWVVAGVRLENTAIEGWGPLNDINAQYQRDASGNFVRNAAGQRVLITSDALALRKLRYVERGSHAERDYHGYYPSLNLSYSISDSIVLRGAYARTIGRPNVTLVIPGVTISEPDVAVPTITVTNTALQPWTADSYDLSIESYYLKDGFGSVGVFQKNIKNFFGTLRTPATPELLEQYGLGGDPGFLDYDISTRINDGDAEITGVEFNFRQALSFLPRWARGFQVFGNATKMWLKGSNTADFDGFNPQSVAGGINFIRPRYFVKLSVTHQGETRRDLVAASATVPANTYNYQAERTRWALSAQYSFSKRYALYGSISDIQGGVGSGLRFAPGTPEYAKYTRYQELGYYTTIGIKGQF
ncbi:MAG: TonB-dependent receptor [Verrucomicrobiota bacterium]